MNLKRFKLYIPMYLSGETTIKIFIFYICSFPYTCKTHSKTIKYMALYLPISNLQLNIFENITLKNYFRPYVIE